MAGQCMSEQDAADTMEKFRSVETEKGGKQFHQEHEAEVAKWEAAFS